MSELPHGWTLEDLAALARRVARSSHARGALTDGEAQDAASCAIVEMLYESDASPSRSDLIAAGYRAIHAEQASIWRSHGVRNDTGGPSPRFHAYWHGGHRLTEGGFEERIDERLALLAVWRELPFTSREALAAMVAADGDRDLAASDLGISPAAFRSALTRARHHARALWAWPEPPARQWGSDRRSNGGANSISRRMRRRESYRRTA